MERSEMIKEIVEGVCGSYDIDEKRATEILEIIEKTGMLKSWGNDKSGCNCNPNYEHTCTHNF